MALDVNILESISKDTNDITFDIENTRFSGKLIYSEFNTIEIHFYSTLDNFELCNKLFENNTIINIFGKFQYGKKFTAAKCNIFSSPINFVNVPCKLDIGTLYLNNWIKTEETMITTAKIDFSYIDEWILNSNDKVIFIKELNCSIIFAKTIVLKFSDAITLKELNDITHSIQTFLKVIIENRDIYIIKNYFTSNNIQIEEVLKNTTMIIKNKKIKSLCRYKEKEIENLLNEWFISKEKYGKVYNYLSGILNENSFKYLEFKFFALSQWLEGYCEINYYTEQEIKKIQEEQRKLSEKIEKQIDKIDDNELLKKHYQFKSEYSFRNKLKRLFKSNFLSKIISSKQKRLDIIDDIVYIRNNTTHINRRDDLDSQKIVDLYMILKNIIYLGHL